MTPYPLPSGECTVFDTRLLHGEECVVTNCRILMLSPGHFHQIPLREVAQVTAHTESYLPWVAWTRFFPVRVYRASTEAWGADLVLECTSETDMRALAAAIEHGAVSAEDRVKLETPAGRDGEASSPGDPSALPSPLSMSGREQEKRRRA